MAVLNLQPHPGDADMGPLQVSASARIDGNVLHVRWRLVDPAGQIVRAEFTSRREQRNHLWHETCFEAFLAAKDQPGYWELNVSPAGHWNLFRFAAYRLPAGTACPVESLVESLIVRREDRVDGMELEAELPLAPLALQTGDLELGLCAMLFAGDGHRGHWALHHPGERPDFHQRKGFVLRIGTGRQSP
jgi:hypothetical protein